MTQHSYGPDANPAAHIQTLIDLTASLNLIFEEENAAIEAQRASDVAPLQAEKARLASAYAQSIRAIAADRAGMGAVDHDLLLQLRQVTERFETRAAHQRSLLNGMDDVSPGMKDEPSAAADSDFSF
jgi:hypothetical protein